MHVMIEVLEISSQISPRPSSQTNPGNIFINLFQVTFSLTTWSLVSIWHRDGSAEFISVWYGI